MEFADLDEKPPEDHIYEIVYQGGITKFSGRKFYLVPFGDLEHRVLAVFQGSNMGPNGTVPKEVKDYIYTSILKLGIGHLKLMFPKPGDSFLEN